MTQPSTPRQVVYVDAGSLTANGYVPSLVTEGEPGHAPLLGNGPHARPWYWGHDLERAQAIAEKYNRQLGVEPDEADRIIASSMAAGDIGRQDPETAARWDELKAGAPTP